MGNRVCSVLFGFVLSVTYVKQLGHRLGRGKVQERARLDSNARKQHQPGTTPGEKRVIRAARVQI